MITISVILNRLVLTQPKNIYRCYSSTKCYEQYSSQTSEKTNIQLNIVDKSENNRLPNIILTFKI